MKGVEADAVGKFGGVAAIPHGKVGDHASGKRPAICQPQGACRMNGCPQKGLGRGHAEQLQAMFIARSNDGIGEEPGFMSLATAICTP